MSFLTYIFYIVSSMKSSMSIFRKTTQETTTPRSASPNCRKQSSRIDISKKQKNKNIRVKNVQFQTPNGDIFTMVSST